MAHLFLAILCTLNTEVLAWVGILSSLTSYQNEFREEFTFNAGEDQMITGLSSIHVNNDRRFRFWTGSAPGVQCVSTEWTSWENDLDGHLSFSCGSNQVLSGISSYHENWWGDRRFKFLCCEVSENVQLINRRETDYLNSWDDDVHFRCGISEALSGLESYHSLKGHEDRIWKATCVALEETGNNDVMLTYRNLSDYVNELREFFRYDDLQWSGWMFTGMASYHQNGYEDRRFQVYAAKFNNGFSCGGWYESSWYNKADKEFDYRCGGNRVLNGFGGSYSAAYKDREFFFFCCDVTNKGDWHISNIYLTGYINELDGGGDYKCGYMEVVVGLYSYHDNSKQDRRYKLYCGRLTPTDDLTTAVYWNNLYKISGWLNSLQGLLNYTTSNNEFIWKIYTRMRDRDRVFGTWTSPLTGATCQPKEWSSYVNDHGTMVDYLCPANHSLAGMYSEYSGNDRIWKFRCCDVSASGTYMLGSPVLGDSDHECSRYEMFVGAYSVYDASNGDRRWQFYCSQVQTKTSAPSPHPTKNPIPPPTIQPSLSPSALPSTGPTEQPTVTLTEQPTVNPSLSPSSAPSAPPTTRPSEQPVCVERVLVWNQETALAALKDCKGGTGESDKNYSAGMCRNHDRYQEEFELSLANRLWTECTSVCVYNIFTDSVAAFRWNRKKQCWNAKKSGSCLTGNVYTWVTSYIHNTLCPL